MSKNHFLIRPPIEADERVDAYALRVCTLNGLPAVPATLAVKALLPRSGQSAELLHLSEMTGTPIITLEQRSVAASYEFMGRRFRINQINTTRRKLCSVCLSERLVYPWYWAIRLVTVCPEHHCELVDVCDCGKPLNWRSGHERCDCGQYVTNLPSYLGTEEQLHCTRVAMTAAGLGDPSWNIPPWQQQLSLEELQALSLMAHHFRHDLPAGRDRDMRHAQSVGAALADWPTGFHALLSRQLKEARVRFPALIDVPLEALDKHTRLGSRWLRKSASGPVSDAFYQWHLKGDDGGAFELARRYVPEIRHFIDLPDRAKAQAMGLTTGQLSMLAVVGALNPPRVRQPETYDLAALAAMLAELVRSSRGWEPRADFIPLSSISPSRGDQGRKSAFSMAIVSVIGGEIPLYSCLEALDPGSFFSPRLFDVLYVTTWDLKRVGNPWPTFSYRSKLDAIARYS